MNFVIGARGRLGRAIVASSLPGQVTAPERQVYANWWRDGAADDISRFFEKSALGDAIVFVAAGILDPGLPTDEHQAINFLLAKHVVEGAGALGLRVVTFGTVTEKLLDGNTSNPYISSKIRLANFVEAYSANQPLPLHIRIHTLYGGGLPPSFMFLGQILQAMGSRSEFRMSPGSQLREYHHIDDEISAIVRLATSPLSGVVDLSHGAPVTLKELATYVFSGLGCTDQLKIGALAEPLRENYGTVFERNPLLVDLQFRPTLAGVADYLSLCRKQFNPGEQAAGRVGQ